MEEAPNAFVHCQQDDWLRLLPVAELTRNNEYLDTTYTSMFFANYKFHSYFHADLLLGQGLEYMHAQIFVSIFNEIVEEVKVEIAKA